MATPVEHPCVSGLLPGPGWDISRDIMKYLVALLALFLVSFSAFAEEPPKPAISARQALDAAENYIKERGLQGDIYVESVTLTRSSMFGGETYWFVKWSHPLVASDPAKREVGIKMRMDGSVTRLVKGIAS